MKATRRYNRGVTEAAHGRMSRSQVTAAHTFEIIFAAACSAKLDLATRLQNKQMLAQIAAEIGRFDFVILRETIVFGQTIRSLADSLYGPSTRRRRKDLSPRTRFEVLKRDGFACRYCGRRAPEVTLHCDHVVSHVSGGSDDMENLAASCPDCNYGKSDNPISGAPRKREKGTFDRAARERYLGARYRDALAVVESVLRQKVFTAAVENSHAA